MQYVPTLENMLVPFINVLKDKKLLEQSLEMLMTIVNNHKLC